MNCSHIYTARNAVSGDGLHRGRGGGGEGRGKREAGGRGERSRTRLQKVDRRHKEERIGEASRRMGAYINCHRRKHFSQRNGDRFGVRRGLVTPAGGRENWRGESRHGRPTALLAVSWERVWVWAHVWVPSFHDMDLGNQGRWGSFQIVDIVH
ncbi:hypothetical protein CBR_g23521 [Chara braunii]|uniref:Uncharacterized protein n=1 Tax=Chara braunii TaxID=69332 RepID=A0A388L4G4_CHABU|nr:hypothetical protein CBR_g23521 [Chara braunii]|eukprot:GBG77194.1 hypothetical protein CBR_g23521 [Chara braunii]